MRGTVSNVGFSGNKALLFALVSTCAKTLSQKTIVTNEMINRLYVNNLVNN